MQAKAALNKLHHTVSEAVLPQPHEGSTDDAA